MTTWNWIALGMWLAAQVTALVIFHIKNQVRMNTIEKDMEALKETVMNNRKDFHIHEKNNEVQFEKYHNEVKDIYKEIKEDRKDNNDKINKMYDILLSLSNKNHN